MKVSTENDNNFGYEKITIVVDNIPLTTIVAYQVMKGGRLLKKKILTFKIKYYKICMLILRLKVKTGFKC
jgi:hypothetical protein